LRSHGLIRQLSEPPHSTSVNSRQMYKTNPQMSVGQTLNFRVGIFLHPLIRHKRVAGGFSPQGVSVGDRFARTVDLLITNKNGNSKCSGNSTVISESDGMDGHRLPSCAVELLHKCYTDCGVKSEENGLLLSSQDVILHIAIRDMQYRRHQ
jgi:hypothetical protein